MNFENEFAYGTKRIIGVKRVSGVSKKSGKPYSGYNIWYEEPRNGVQGFAADNAYVSDEVLAGEIPAVGGHIQLSYNRNGYLEAVCLVCDA